MVLVSDFITVLYWLTLIAVVGSAASGVLKAGDKQFDLFGVVIIAITTALGGGSLRDMLLDRDVFWVYDQVFFVASVVSAIITFMVARVVRVRPQHFLITDAAGLATFSIAGTIVALSMDISIIAASFMGMLTGVMGGIMRDVLCNEHPIVFTSALYATLSWGGALGFIALLHFGMSTVLASVIVGLLIFVLRLWAIRTNVGLPKFRFK